MNSKQEFKWFLPSVGHFPRGCGRAGRQPGVSYTYQWHRIPRTPAGSHSAACRQPVSSSTRSGRCHHWSHTRARSHCYTDGKAQRAAALVTQAGDTAPHTYILLPASSKTWGNNRQGDTDDPLLTFTAARGEGGDFYKETSDLKRLGER